MDIFYVMGIVGVVCILIAFIIGNYNDLDKRTKADEIFNLIGSVLLLLYAFDGGLWPFVVLNTIWAGWSIWLLIPKKQL